MRKSVMMALIGAVALLLCACSNPFDSSVGTQMPREQISFTDHGNALETVSVYTGQFYDFDGKSYYFGTTSAGNGVRIFRYDPSAKRVDWVVPIPSSGGAWALHKEDDWLYVAGYNPAVLYRVNLRTSTVEPLVAASGETVIFSMTVGGNALYFGTYPSAKLYSYNLISGAVRSYGRLSEQSHIRSLTYLDNIIYAGVGSRAELVAVDATTGSFENILPTEFSSDSFVFCIDQVNGFLFLGLSPSYKVVKYDPVTKRSKLMMTDAKLGQPGISPRFGPSLYHFSGIEGIIFQYDSAIDELLRLPAPEQSPNYWVTGSHIDDQQKIVGVLSTGMYFEMNLDGSVTSTVDFQQVGLPGAPVRPYAIASYNGWVYVAESWLRYFNPAKNVNFLAPIAGQAKQIQISSDSLITANYGGAYIWKLPLGDSVVYTKDIDFRDQKYLLGRVGEGQNRPLNIGINEIAGEVLVCTEPDYGRYGGALWKYSHVSSQQQTYLDIMPNHSISAVAAGGDKESYYLGTSVWGGTGSMPLNDDARVIKYSTLTSTGSWNTRVPGSKTVYQVQLYNKKLFAIVDGGNIIEVDLGTGAIVASYETNNPQKLIASVDGNLYLLGNRELYRWDQATGSFVVIYSGFGDAYRFTEDASTGKLIIVDGVRLLISV